MINTRKVHVFGVEGIDSCSYEEYSLLFNKDFDVDNFLYKNNKKINNYIGKIMGISLFIASNPKYILAFGKETNVFASSIGNDLFSKATEYSIIGVLIITAFRFLAEYSRGGSKYRTLEIFKECVLIILAIIVLPYTPRVLEAFLNKHFDF